MRLEAINAHLQKRPFVPFRIFLSNGATHDVRHPEMMLLSRLEIVVADRLGEDKIAHRFAYIDPVHIVKLEPINGEKTPAAE